MQDASKLVQHHAAKLGAATHEANNHKITVTLDGGATVECTVRDSTAERPRWRARGGTKRSHEETLPDLTPSAASLPSSSNNAPEEVPACGQQLGASARRCAEEGNSEAQT